MIHYQDEDPQVIMMLVLAFEKAYHQVNEFFSYQPQKKIAITLYPSMEELGQSFGWEKDESAIGVYSNGKISLLTPPAWMKNEYSQQELETQGPVLHEYTHYAIDEITRGNYTRWWTEGVAQYLEKKVNGFQFKTPRFSAHEEVYTLYALEKNFDELNQSKVYWQSLMAVQYIVETYGEATLIEVQQELSNGKIFHKAVENSLKIDYDKFAVNYYQYLYRQMKNHHLDNTFLPDFLMNTGSGR